MAAGAWDHTTAMMTVTGAAFGGKPHHPDKANPFRQRPTTKAAKELQAKESWLELKAGLKAFAGGR